VASPYNKVENLKYFIDIKNKKISLIKESENIENLGGIIFENNLSKEDFLSKLSIIIETNKINDDDFFKLGIDLLVFCAEKSKLFKLENVLIEKKLNRVIIPDINLEKKLLQIITHDSELLPMIHKPEDWCLEITKEGTNTFEKNYNINNYGGYLLNKENNNDIIRQSKKSIGVTRLYNLDIIQAINCLSSIKYSINNNVLIFYFNLLEKNDERLLNLIKIDLHPNTKNIQDLKFSINNIELNQILKHNSQYYCDSTVLQNALLFSK